MLLFVVVMRFEVVLGVVVGGAIASDLQSLPKPSMKEFGNMNYRRFSNFKLPFGGPNAAGLINKGLASGDLYTNNLPGGVSAVFLLENKHEFCGDEFVGFKNFNDRKLSQVLETSGYEFCGMSNKVKINPDDYEVETNLNCNDKTWQRLECKFSPRGEGPGNEFVASRVGKKDSRWASQKTLNSIQKSAAKKTFKALVGGELELMSPFGVRVPCDKTEEEKQYQECLALLRGWAAIDYAFEEKLPQQPQRKSGNVSPNAKSKAKKETEETEEAADSKTDKDGDEDEGNMKWWLIGGGVGALVLIVIAAVMLSGSSKGDDKSKKIRSAKRHKHDPEEPDAEPTTVHNEGVEERGHDRHKSRKHKHK